MVEESEIIRLFQELKKIIERDERYLKTITKPEVKKFWEGLVEGKKLMAFNICEYFKNIERPELSEPCEEILLKEEKLEKEVV